MAALFGLGMGTVLIIKEVADFIQIGLIAWQTGKRFSGSRTVGGRSVSIDGGVVRVQGEGFSVELPLDDAARAVGVAGAAGRGDRHTLEQATAAGVDAYAALSRARAGLDPLRGQVANPSKPRPGEGSYTVAGGPDLDSRPFTARELFTMQQRTAQLQSQTKTQRELELERMQEAHALRLALITDARLREQAALEFRAEEDALRVKVQLAREQQQADLETAAARFQYQLALDTAEREWKGTEAAVDRAWRERTQRELSDLAEYQKNLSADLAVDRSVRAARALGEIKTSLAFRPPPWVHG